MNDFNQTTKRSDSLFGMFICVCFVLVPIDSKYFQFLVEDGLEETPWLFWGMGIIGSWGTLGFAWQFVRPFPVLAADANGIKVGASAKLRFGRSRKHAGTIPWEQVVSISIAEMIYSGGPNDSVTRHPALRIEFDDSLDMSYCDNMQAIQSGTRAYFAARAEIYAKTGTVNIISFEEPQGCNRNENIILIGSRHFSKNLDLVCKQLQKMAEG